MSETAAGRWLGPFLDAAAMASLLAVWLPLACTLVSLVWYAVLAGGCTARSGRCWKMDSLVPRLWTEISLT